MDRGLGVQDLKAFNLVLLAKKWWRLIHNEDSLSFKVLKARYFPSSDTSKVETTQRASFIWRSLLKGNEVVSLRATWKVGNGQKIRVWRDKWITQLPTRGPSHPCHARLAGRCVTTTAYP